MGEFNVDKTTGGLIPTAGYGGYIKKTGSTISELVTALNGMTEDQRDRCVITATTSETNAIVRLRRSRTTKNNTADAYTSEMVNSNANTVQFALNALDATFAQVNDNNSTVVLLTITSWKILYQDDSPSGGNTYPASQVMLESGDSVEEALDELQIKKTTISGTTDSNGIIETNLSRASKLILSVYSGSSIQNFIQIGFNSSGNYIFRFTNNTGAARPGVAFTVITIYYMDIASS